MTPQTDILDDQKRCTLFKKYIPEDFLPGKPNCGVLAIAVALGVDYHTVENTIRRMYDKCGRWKGRMYWHEIIGVVEQLDPGMTDEISLPRCSIKNMVRQKLSPDGCYLFFVGGHFVMYKDGLLFDNCWPYVHTLDERTGRKIVKKTLSFVN